MTPEIVERVHAAVRRLAADTSNEKSVEARKALETAETARADLRWQLRERPELLSRRARKP